MHKPPGYVCTHAREDPESKIVFDLLPVCFFPPGPLHLFLNFFFFFLQKQILSLTPKLSVAGRLDKWATGLLILSQDGHLINRIIKHAALPKQYLVNLKQFLFPFFFLLIVRSDSTDWNFMNSDCKGNEPELFKTPIQLRSEKEPCLPADLEIVEPKLVRFVFVFFFALVF